ncbi:beta-1,3-glucanase [Carex littledalei]|uniref:Beta-1,3-glucanase n=1 Tax=Carex littledalei TaxID=544730 RepID=A0A833RH31_9POAL|nr:beta-1,3-glucanase [Carex littledalei]
MVGDNLPPPSDVVELYRSNGITAMRLYAPNDTTLRALKDTGIHVMMGVDDGTLEDLATNPSAAPNWVRTNILPYPQVSFKYIVVGNEVAPGDAHNYILPAMSKMWDAICKAGYKDKIKVSTAVCSLVLTNTYPPSKSQFNPSYTMGPIVEFLSETGNPLLANIYPYFSYKDNYPKIDLNYALFKPSTAVVQDGTYKYTNLFDAMVDSVYYALEKAGGSRVGVVVSESGWPSDGGLGATKENAKTYNQNLINHVVSGTPKNKTNLETYVFAMFNENMKPNDNGREVERYFGLFYPTNKSPVYPISFNNVTSQKI